jgi:hypothetical protein
MTSCSSTRGQLNIDLIISYLLFIFFLVFLFQFVVNLTTPFTNAMVSSRENQVIDVVKAIMSKNMEFKDLAESCLIYHEQVESMRTEFTINGFPMPETDTSYTQPNQTGGNLVFVRDRNKLNILVGTEDIEKNVSLVLIFPKSMYASIVSGTNESNDYAGMIQDVFGNKVLEIDSRVNSTDEDQFTILTQDEGIVAITSLSGMSYENVFVGDVPLQITCGLVKGGYSSSLEGYTTITKNQKLFPSKYKVNIWWFK